MNLPGGVFRQVEGAALVKGGKERAAALKFIAFLRSPAVQTALQTEMWMFPAIAATPRADALRHAPEPSRFDAPSDTALAQNGAAWVARWVKVVLK